MDPADQLLKDSEGIQDECGVFGVWAPDEDVAKMAYYGLFALQHRGQEAAGIATSDGERIAVYKDVGLVSQVFTENALSLLKGFVAVGHTRYSTAGGLGWENAQPTLGGDDEITIALAHNGNVTNSEILERLLKDTTNLYKRQDTPSDTAIVTALLVDHEHPTLEERALEVLPLIKGAYCFVFMDEHTLYAARDPHGVRPLVIGRLDRGWVIASETSALDIIGANFVREVSPGELIAIDENGLRSVKFAEASLKVCSFEYIYLARPDGAIAGQNIYQSRVEMGKRLAREHPVEADLVIPTPESGTPAAIGFAQESGIPYSKGIVKNAYVGRTFITPSQTIRQQGIKLKLNPIREVVEGKRLVIVDDSIVRGNTQRAVVRMLREAGAKEVHVRISSPPVKYPCHYGIDFPSPAELISNGLNAQEVCTAIGADSLGYISLEGMIEATNQPSESLCKACFNGEYLI